MAVVRRNAFERDDPVRFGALVLLREEAARRGGKLLVPDLRLDRQNTLPVAHDEVDLTPVLPIASGRTDDNPAKRRPLCGHDLFGDFASVRSTCRPRIGWHKSLEMCIIEPMKNPGIQ